jgi:hypothetical protein
VQPGAYRQTEIVHPLDDRAGAADRSRWAVEGGQEAVAGGFDLTAAKSQQLAPYHRVVTAEQIAPAPVTELGCVCRRVHDVCKTGRWPASGRARFPATRRINREKDPRSVRDWAKPGSRHCISIWVTKPGTKTRSNGPSPTSW